MLAIKEGEPLDESGFVQNAALLPPLFRAQGMYPEKRGLLYLERLKVHVRLWPHIKRK